MCGWLAITTARFHRIEGTATTFPEVCRRYKISPSQSIPVILESADGTHELVGCAGGPSPTGRRTPRPPTATFNVRVETVADKPAFRGPFRSRRCLVPAYGFYEWKTEIGRKQPYYLTVAADGGLAFAGPTAMG